MRAATAALLILCLAGCATPTEGPSPPEGARTWSGAESDVVPAIVAEADPETILTLRYESNGAFVVISHVTLNTGAQAITSPDGYCYRIYAELNPVRDGSRANTFENERYCLVFRGDITVWEGDIREWR